MRLAHLDFEDTEIAQFHGCAFGHCLGDEIKGPLEHLQHLPLDHARFFAYFDYQITFCHSICDQSHLSCGPRKLSLEKTEAHLLPISGNHQALLILQVACN